MSRKKYKRRHGIPLEYEKHHKKCTSNGGDNSKDNVSWVSRARHQAWHILTGNTHPEEIAEVINRDFLDPDYELVAVKVNPNAKPYPTRG